MNIPKIHGFIERRILVNYTADPTVVSGILPAPFTPKLYKGKAIVGICLIRLKSIKPKGFPKLFGVSSENAAHRFAVEWTDESGQICEGVYIPRRDTSLYLNTLVGGRFFPGKHNFANFNIRESNANYHLDALSSDQNHIQIDARRTSEFPLGSIFDNIEEVSQFFEKGSIGYSPNGKSFDGLKLNTYNWEISPLEVQNIKSTYFDDKNRFPEGSIQFDHAVIMLNIEHDWQSMKSISCL
ncbi:DUF2071 domain-containing protein [Sphingobacterium sp. NPDC055346]